MELLWCDFFFIPKQVCPRGEATESQHVGIAVTSRYQQRPPTQTKPSFPHSVLFPALDILRSPWGEDPGLGHRLWALFLAFFSLAIALLIHEFCLDFLYTWKSHAEVWNLKMGDLRREYCPAGSDSDISHSGWSFLVKLHPASPYSLFHQTLVPSPTLFPYLLLMIF